MLTSRTQLAMRQTLVLSAILLLAAFFISLDILRTFWNLTVSLSDNTNLILLWRVIEPIVAASLAALSGLADWCRVHRPAPNAILEGNRSWIEIGRVGKKEEEV